MTPKQAWKTLGIDATSDKRAIKRAYAGKLKSIDPDKDPKSFLTLRDALQAATWDAAYVDDDDYQTWGEDTQELSLAPVEEAHEERDSLQIEPISDAELERDSPLPDSPAHDPEPFDEIDPPEWDEQPDPDYDENAPRNRISTILWGDDDIRPLEDELRALTHGLIESLETETIDVAGETENWFGWIVSATMRRSDCMIPILMRQFDWKTKASGVNAPYYMDDIIARYRDLVRITALRKTGHPDHETYVRLCADNLNPLSRTDVWFHRSAVRAFVTRTRADNPTIEWDFNPDTMAAWEPHLSSLANRETNTGEKSSWGSWRLGFFALLFLSQLLRACPDTTDTTIPANLPPATKLGQYDGNSSSDIDTADPPRIQVPHASATIG
jgi:hypothetical protein